MCITIFNPHKKSYHLGTGITHTEVRKPRLREVIEFAPVTWVARSQYRLYPVQNSLNRYATMPLANRHSLCNLHSLPAPYFHILVMFPLQCLCNFFPFFISFTTRLVHGHQESKHVKSQMISPLAFHA